MTEIKSKIDTDINSNCFTRVRGMTGDVGYWRGRLFGSGSRIESNGSNNIGNITPYETHNRLYIDMIPVGSNDLSCLDDVLYLVAYNTTL